MTILFGHRVNIIPNLIIIIINIPVIKEGDGNYYCITISINGMPNQFDFNKTLAQQNGHSP